jgi:hypothetical protein
MHLQHLNSILILVLIGKTILLLYMQSPEAAAGSTKEGGLDNKEYNGLRRTATIIF